MAPQDKIVLISGFVLGLLLTAIGPGDFRISSAVVQRRNGNHSLLHFCRRAQQPEGTGAFLLPERRDRPQR